MRSIIVLRGQKVLLDRELANLYWVKAIALRQQVKRNPTRFPDDFMFQLSRAEVDLLVSQNVIASRRSLGGSLPYAFTREGVAMLSSVLTSNRAVQVNVAIMRAFVRMQELLVSSEGLAKRLDEIEASLKKKFLKHGRKLETHEQAIVGIFKALRELRNPPTVRAIGFTANF